MASPLIFALASAGVTEAAEDRFWARVDKDAPGGCWLWRGTCDSAGYGIVQVANTIIPAHRMAKMLVERALYTGWRWKHSCEVRHCVNPEHVYHVYAADPVKRKQRLSDIRTQHEFEMREWREWRAQLDPDIRTNIYIWTTRDGKTVEEIALHLKAPVRVVERFMALPPPSQARIEAAL